MENHRKLLKENGYCNFELKEYSEEFAKYLEQFKCSPTKNMKDSFNSLRLDTNSNKTYEDGHHQKTFETFDLVKKYADEVLSEDGLRVKQFWYHKGIHEEYKNYDINEEYIRDFFRNLGRYLYDNESVDVSGVDFTYYDIGGMIESHRDAPEHYNGRLCNILIYLNETYDDNDGGLLILNDEIKVSPTFGNVVVIDLKKFNTKHEVTKVTNGMGRYALLSFIGLKD